MKSLHTILVDNIIQLKNTYNTRTIGGFVNKNNLKVKKGILFRSDNLARLDDYDLNVLNLVGIKRIVDFRSIREKTKEPNILPPNVTYIESPIEADKSINEEIYKILDGTLEKNMNQFLIDANKDFVLEYTSVFSKFIKEFIQSGETTLFHCTAGKDRTGFACALILSILDVPKETIMGEYMFSNHCINRTIDRQLYKVCGIMNINMCDSNKILPLLTVQSEYIENAFKTIEEEYGNINNYIKKGLKLSEKEILTLKILLLG